MSGRSPEEAALLAELEARAAALPDGLAAHLAAELPAVRARWPHGPAFGAGFAEHLAARLAPRPRVEDLYLAWWCGTGDAAGIAAFEALFDADLRHAAAGFRDLAADELRQLLRIKLFVGTPGTPPKIRDYTGRGSLQGWVRVTAVRTFVDAARATRSRRYERELDEAELLGLADPQGKAIGAELGAAVKRAFAEAVARLAPRQRVFLRHAYVDRHTLDQIATHYALHRATVARTLAAAREQLIADTRAGLAAAIGIGGDEMASVIRGLESHVELSLSRVLGSSELRRY